MISVILASRGRPALLERLVGSVLATAADLEQVEVIVRCDQDDDATLAVVRTLGWPAVVGPRPLGYAGLSALVNQAARLACGELLIVVNDDAEFQTPGWDRLLALRAAQYPDGIFNLGVDTVLNNPNFVFPCQSRRQVDVLGHFFDERLVYPDLWLRDVLRPFGRAVPVPEVRVAHQWQGESADQAAAAAVTRTPEGVRLYAQCVEEGRAKIRAVLPC